ncbi:hypothetical protein PT974_01352 [Cladobotryum mycophilum]|uniref:Uncharacterized protein n=1 Tax=Cladobotryum mycophilum TaxID=491253 RepID=A0ABR0T3F7_9HYPO
MKALIALPFFIWLLEAASASVNTTLSQNTSNATLWETTFNAIYPHHKKEKKKKPFEKEPEKKPPTRTAPPEPRPWELWKPLPHAETICDGKIRDGRRPAVNQTDYKRAVRNLGDFCDRFNVSPDGFYVAIVGHVQVYVCNWDGRNSTPCHRNEYSLSERLMDTKCGEGVNARVRLRRRRKVRKTYGRGQVGQKICDGINKQMGKDYLIAPLPVWVDGKIGKAGEPEEELEERKEVHEYEYEDEDEEEGKEMPTKTELEMEGDMDEEEDEEEEEEELE